MASVQDEMVGISLTFVGIFRICVAIPDITLLRFVCSLKYNYKHIYTFTYLAEYISKYIVHIKLKKEKCLLKFV